MSLLPSFSVLVAMKGKNGRMPFFWWKYQLYFSLAWGMGDAEKEDQMRTRALEQYWSTFAEQLNT